MSQTREDRMLLHYRSLMRQFGHRYPADIFGPEAGAEHVNTYVWLPMARTWKMPARSVKNLIRDLRRQQ